MDEINQQVSRVLEDTKTIRIVADIPTKLLASDNYFASAASFTEPFKKHWETQHIVRFIVVDVYPRHTYVIYDINNHRYHYETAHKQTFSVPVYILRFKSNRWMFFRQQTEDQRIARDIAEVHRHEGQNAPPFFADHIKGPVYLSPRTD
ncbi:uncharacterized protein DSM5745_10186 [Aspergillus mulundensis]|uniref:Uncharacterized protein n=1 Tax=Aspergillus mulundensis TaxID=1810919 RepID=A0A3D8QMQ8_9EURO|nr:Uncharacterized protein DSM5745_10186 [Aspergillus mulundensis]RDW63075.1 Uncharacterized protein DSM5745_10186 [Aspergillus mulundensis]